MQRPEVHALLVRASLVDQRIIIEQMVDVWEEALAGIEFEDAKKALAEHRRESTEYLQPAHIVQRVRAAHPYDRSTEFDPEAFYG